MALYNKHGVKVNLPKDAKEELLIPLREMHLPVTPYPKGMFSIEARAKMKN